MRGLVRQRACIGCLARHTGRRAHVDKPDTLGNHEVSKMLINRSLRDVN